jgi:adenylate cyclase class IV
MGNEYELKFLAIEKNVMRTLLSDHGFAKTKPEVLMKRQTFHLPKAHPEHESKWGRVRDEGNRITATVKWYEDPKRPTVSQVHEEEIIAKTWEDGVNWITAQGFCPTAYQENTREAWRRSGDTHLEITIDTWPGLKPYVEIEAPNVSKLNAIAEELGFNPAEGIAGGTEIIYEIEAGIPAPILKAMPRITFDSPPRAQG